MTDKVQKIREEVVRVHNLLPVMDGDNISVNYADRICTTLEMYIDSLQEEPVSEEIEVSYEAKINEAHRLGREEGMFLAKTMFKEPVSEELEEAAKRYATEGDEISGLHIIDEEVEAFKAGAKWQEEQFEKNRLAACDRQTEKEAEIERDFVMGIIEKEHRQPTFDDAIKYGIRFHKKQMMIEAIDAHCFGFQGDALFSFKLPADNYLVGSEVKVIVIKED